MQVGCMEIGAGKSNEDSQRDQLDHDQNDVERRALPRASDEHAHHRQRDGDGWQVDDSAAVRPHQQGVREMHPGGFDPADKIARPADCHGRARERIFQDQAPADHPGNAFAERRIAEGIGTAGGRNHRRQLGISERGAPADQAANDEGEDHRRPGALGADSDQRVDSGADDRADSQRDEVRPAQGLGEARVLGVTRNAVERLTWSEHDLSWKGESGRGGRRELQSQIVERRGDMLAQLSNDRGLVPRQPGIEQAAMFKMGALIAPGRREMRDDIALGQDR